MSQVYFDDSQLSVVNEWMDKVNDGKKLVAASSISTPFAAASKRGGLGHKIVQSQHMAKSKLLQRMGDKEKDGQSKKKKKKGKKDVDGDDSENGNNDNDDDDEEEEIKHGIIDKLSGSKASAVKQTKATPKPESSTSSSKADTLAEKKRKYQAELEQKKIQEERGEAPRVKPKHLQEVDKRIQDGTEVNASGPTKKVKRPFKHLVGLSNNGADENGNVPRKRPKTRSKQKNIRKDNRPDDQKPSYLLGSPNREGFAGRPLTKETKKILGLPVDDDDTTKKEKKQKKSHKHEKPMRGDEKQE